MNKTPPEKSGNRIESVLNGVLVAVFVGAAFWAAVAPTLLPVLNKA